VTNFLTEGTSASVVMIELRKARRLFFAGKNRGVVRVVARTQPTRHRCPATINCGRVAVAVMDDRCRPISTIAQTSSRARLADRPRDDPAVRRGLKTLSVFHKCYMGASIGYPNGTNCVPGVAARRDIAEIRGI